MRKIRKGLFETNSSSMHSLVIKCNGENVRNISDEYYNNKLEKFKDNLGNRIIDGEFDVYGYWEDDRVTYDRSPFEIISDPIQKLRYFIISDYNKGYIGLDLELNKFMNKYCTDFIKIKSFDYMDCYSSGSLYLKLKERNISIEDFVLNNKYYVVVDGDEYGIYETMIEDGIIDENSIEEDIIISY